MQHCREVMVVVDQLGNNLCELCPESDRDMIVEKLNSAKEGLNDILEMQAEKENRLITGKNIIKDYSEAIDNLVNLCSEVESNYVMSLGDNHMKLKDLNVYNTELQVFMMLS